jgi:hypothetical protein
VSKFLLAYRSRDSAAAVRGDDLSRRPRAFHTREFERLEDDLTWGAFFDFEGEPFIAAQAHADAW